MYAIHVISNDDVIIVGQFNHAYDVTARNIARWHAGTWSAFGAGCGSPNTISEAAYALCVRRNGVVVVGGNFRAAGGQPINYVAEWNGSAWSPLGTGPNYNVYSLAEMPNGDLIVGGIFTAAGNVPANRIARWNGMEWNSLGSGMNPSYVFALAAMPNGDLFAGGGFTNVGGVTANRIAKWRTQESPAILLQPQNQSVCLNANATVSVGVDPNGQYKYEWRRNGVPIDSNPSQVRGEDSATLTVLSAHADDAGQYQCLVYNTCGSILTVPMTLSVVAATPADTNGDGQIDGDDVQRFLQALLTSGGPAIARCASDVNEDGLVNVADVEHFVKALIGPVP